MDKTLIFGVNLILLINYQLLAKEIGKLNEIGELKF